MVGSRSRPSARRRWRRSRAVEPRVADGDRAVARRDGGDGSEQRAGDPERPQGPGPVEADVRGESVPVDELAPRDERADVRRAGTDGRNATTSCGSPFPSGLPSAAATTLPLKPASERGRSPGPPRPARERPPVAAERGGVALRQPPAEELHRGRGADGADRNARTPPAPASTSSRAPRCVPGMCWSKRKLPRLVATTSGGRRSGRGGRGSAGRRAAPAPDDVGSPGGRLARELAACAGRSPARTPCRPGCRR